MSTISVQNISNLSNLSVSGTFTVPNVNVTNNLGVGTSTPVGRLDVSSTSQYAGINLTGTGRIWQVGANSTAVVTMNFQHDALAFTNYGVERMRIAASGNVGIGATVPLFKLDVRDGNGTVANFVGAGGTFQGLGVSASDASASNYRGIFYDVRNENGIPVANMLADVSTDGSSAWAWTTQPAGSRTADRRVERMRIDSLGRVTISNQPAIYIDGNNATNVTFTSGQQLLTTTNYVSRNVRGGMSWNGSTGSVTVPVSGYYSISWSGYHNGSVGRVQIRVNGAVLQLVHTGASGAFGRDVIVSLAANDYVDVIADGFSLPTLWMGPAHTSFTMNLLG